MIDSNTDYRALSFWVLMLQMLVSTVVWVAGWISLRKKATADEIKDVSNQINALRAAQSESCGRHQARTTTLEVQVKNTPTHADLGAVYERLNLVKGSVDALSGAVKGIGVNVNLLVEHHLRGGKGK